jgi:hypothetical protein
MREIRQSGSEGGGGRKVSSYPICLLPATQATANTDTGFNLPPLEFRPLLPTANCQLPTAY